MVSVCRIRSNYNLTGEFSRFIDMKTYFTMILLVFSTLLAGSAFAQKLVIMGSDTLGTKMMPKFKEAYVAKGHKVDFEIAAEGSSQGFANLLSGTADIGMSSREAKDEEKINFIAKGEELVEHLVGWDMVAVIVNVENGVRKLTLREIEGIFTGDIEDWSELGGKPGKISVYTRNTASGTYDTFQQIAMRTRDYGSNSQKMAGTEQVASEVAANPNGIGYVGLAYAEKKGIRSLMVDDIAAKAKNKAKYPLSRKLYFYTVDEPKGESEKFLTWALKTEEGKALVKKVGFIPVD